MDLLARRRAGDEIAIAAPSPDILAPYRDKPSPDAERGTLKYLHLLRSYEAFDPPLATNERILSMLDAVLRFGTGRVALELALELEISAVPAEEIRTTLGLLAERGLKSSTETFVAQEFVSYLLDKQDVRSTVIDELAKWPTEPRLREVVRYLLPQLEDAELRPLINWLG